LPLKDPLLWSRQLTVFEHSAKLIKDPEITGYLSELAEKFGRNSDAHMPISVVILDTKTVNACTSPGGSQYLTRGLLVHAQSESELAAVLSHGVAKTALPFRPGSKCDRLYSSTTRHPEIMGHGPPRRFLFVNGAQPNFSDNRPAGRVATPHLREPPIRNKELCLAASVLRSAVEGCRGPTPYSWMLLIVATQPVVPAK